MNSHDSSVVSELHEAPATERLPPTGTSTATDSSADPPIHPTPAPPVEPPAELTPDAALKALVDLLNSSQQVDTRLTPLLKSLARDLLLQIDPQDAVERMLTAQIIATFNRSMFLARNANRQKHPIWFTLYSKECDRATNLFRKLTQSLADHRTPQRKSSFTSIRNANFAAQQLITTTSPIQILQTETADHGKPDGTSHEKPNPSRPPHPRRRGRPPGSRAPQPPLDP